MCRLFQVALKKHGNRGKRIEVAASLTLARVSSLPRAGRSPNDYGPKLHGSDETRRVRLGGRASNVFGNLFPLPRVCRSIAQRTTSAGILSVGKYVSL